MRHFGDNPDVCVARIAGERHGVIRVDQLRLAGLGKSAVKRRVAAGRLHRRYKGVYSVGHSGLGLEGRWLAAVDACGEGAVLSHLAAACLWALLEWQEEWPIDVTVATPSGRRSGRGIRVHRSTTLLARNVTERTAIPVTTVPRLIFDLPRVADPATARRVHREAEYRGFRKGLPQGYVPTRSELERIMLELCDRHGLPEPKTRVRVGRYEADFLFEEKGLFVETDGWSAHRGRVAFESDHERDLWMKVQGLEFVRLSSNQVKAQPAQTAADLRAILGRL